MNYSKSGLTTGQAIMAVIGLLIFVVAISLGISWVVLLAWNFLAGAAGWSALVPVTWKTVFAATVAISLIRLIFHRNKG